MDNMYSTPGGGFEDHTQPYSFGPGEGPGAAADHLDDQNGWRSRRGGPGRPFRWAAGIAAAALLIGGGAVLGVHLADAGSATTLTGYSQSGNTSQAGAIADLFGTPAAASAAVLSTDPAGGQIPASGLRHCAAVARSLKANGHPDAALGKWRSCVRRFVRDLRWLGGMHGQITFKTKTGTRTIAFERGVIQSVSGSAIVVKAADGTTWPWDLITKTVIFHAGQRTDASALATGDRVFVAGPVVGSADDARIILIRR